MKRTITQNENVYIEFKVPCYVKFSDDILFKIIDESTVVKVKTFNFSTMIEIVSIGQCDPFGNKGWEFTTQEEFKKAFDIAFEKISELAECPNLVALA